MPQASVAVCAWLRAMFDGFALERIVVGEAELRVRHGGAGSPILLLHGHPRTHATWHRVAPLLAGRFTVVCPDLRGYGESSKPETTADHAPYSKRAMAADCAELMRRLGHEQFAVVGHDRGAYVAHRLALDYPERVTKLVVMDAENERAGRRYAASAVSRGCNAATTVASSDSASGTAE